MLILKIWNDEKGTSYEAGYWFRVTINDKVLCSGKIEKYKRNRGWLRLIQTVVSFISEGGRD
jgi:hypothetical protein